MNDAESNEISNNKLLDRVVNEEDPSLSEESTPTTSAENYPEDNTGYGSLLEDTSDVAYEPVNSENEKNKRGLVVGVKQEDTFVNNPVATGATPADAAKAKEEKRKQELALQQAKQQEQKRIREAQEREAKKKQELARIQQQKAQEEQLKQQKAQELARLEEQKKKQQEAALLKQKQEKEAALLKQKQEKEAQALAQKNKAQRLPSGRYLQLGVFSTKEAAEAAKANSKFPISRDDFKKAGGKISLKIDEVSNPGKFVLVVGPSASDEVLQNIKKSKFPGAFTVTR